MHRKHISVGRTELVASTIDGSFAVVDSDTVEDAKAISYYQQHFKSKSTGNLNAILICMGLLDDVSVFYGCSHAINRRLMTYPNLPKRPLANRMLDTSRDSHLVNESDYTLQTHVRCTCHGVLIRCLEGGGLCAAEVY